MQAVEDFATKVSVIQEPGSEVYTPAIQVHREGCDWPNNCCMWGWEYQRHLASPNLETAWRNAHVLANRLGVECGNSYGVD